MRHMPWLVTMRGMADISQSKSSGKQRALNDQRKDVTGAFLTFAIISGLGWLIDVSSAVGLVQLGLSPFVASFVGAGLAVTFVFVVSRWVIFQAQEARRANDFAIYVAWQIFAITVASLLVAAIAHLLAPLASRLIAATAVLPDPLAAATGAGKVIVTPLTLVANFLFMRWLSQRHAAPRGTS